MMETPRPPFRTARPHRAPARLALGLLGALSVFAGAPARAATPDETARDAARTAHRTIQERCPKLYDRAPSPDDQVVISETFRQVDGAFKETGILWLQYWRGALAQCLGRTEWARSDLQAFVSAAAGDPNIDGLRREAERRLERLAGPSAGEGPSSRWLTLRDRWELGASYAAGVGSHQLACVDDGSVASSRVENSACLLGQSPSPLSTVAPVPVGIEVTAAVFPGAALGVGARVALDVPSPSGLPDDRSPGTTLSIRLGPQVRLLSRLSGGQRARGLRAEAGAAFAAGSHSPWAGNAKYVSDLGFLDAGSSPTRAFGIYGGLGAEWEISSRAAMALEGTFAGSLAASLGEGDPPQPALVYDGETTEEVEVLPDPTGLSRLDATARWSLLVAHPTADLAVGPFLDFTWHRVDVRYPDDPSDVWCATPDCGSGDGGLRKVYSTRRDEYLVRFGIAVRLGGGGA